MLWGVLILFEAVTTAILAFRLKVPAAGILIMIYIILMKITFFSFSNLGFQFNFGTTSDMGFFYKGNETLLIYSIIFWAVAISLIWVPRNIEWLKGFQSSLATKMGKRSGTPLLAIIITILFSNLLFMDKSALWSNNEYLLITGPRGYFLQPNIAMILITAMNIGAVMCSIFLPFYLRKNRTQALLALSAWLFWFVFYLSAGSRLTAIMFFSLFAIQFLLSRGRMALMHLVVGFFGAFIIMMIALATRASGEFGISHFFDALSFFSGKVAWDFAIFSWLNFMQGIFITSDGIIYEQYFKNEYKLLSFSPLPSFIDSFDEVRKGAQIMLHKSVPMSGISEIYHFGALYFLFYICVLVFILRTAHKAFRSKSYYLTAFANFYIFIMFVVMNGYAVRNSFRQTLLAYAVLVIAGVLARLKRSLTENWKKPKAHIVIKQQPKLY